MRSDILLFGSGAATEAALAWAIGHRSVHLETAQSLEQATKCLEHCSVDILICDDEGPRDTWLDLLIHAARIHTSLVSIVTAQEPAASTLIRAINEGRVVAFLPKPLSRTGLKHALDHAFTRSIPRPTLHRYEDFTPPGTSHPKRPMAKPGVNPENAANVRGFNSAFSGLPGDLSIREWEVLALLADGLTTRQIAKRLFISVYTVRNHLKSMYRKLQLHSQSELINWHQNSHPQVATG